MGLFWTAGTALLVVATVLGAGGSALAQVHQPGQTLSAGQRSGPLSEVSRPLVDDSPPVHEGTQTLGETSGGPVHSGPVRDSDTRSMLSGPVSDASLGPVMEPRPPITSGSVTEASAGAVKHDIDSPLGERISSPLRELGPLQQAMRERREAAEQAVLEGATQPAAPPLEAVPPPDAAAPATEEGAPIPNEAAAPPDAAAAALHDTTTDEAALTDTGDALPAPDDAGEPNAPVAR